MTKIAIDAVIQNISKVQERFASALKIIASPGDAFLMVLSEIQFCMSYIVDLIDDLNMMSDATQNTGRRTIDFLVKSANALYWDMQRLEREQDNLSPGIHAIEKKLAEFLHECESALILVTNVPAI